MGGGGGCGVGPTIADPQFFFFLCVDVGATIADFVIGVLHVLM